MDPVVEKVAATSGMAERMVVDEMGARKPHIDRTLVMTTFFAGLKRVYCSALISVNVCVKAAPPAMS